MESASPAPKSSRRGLKIAIGVVVVALLLCVGGVAIFAGGIVKATSGPRDVATEYFKAISAHDWAKASGYDSASTAPADLEQSWTQTEAQNGRLQSSSVTNTSINNNEATVEGTLQFANSAKTFTLNLIKDGDNWKLK